MIWTWYSKHVEWSSNRDKQCRLMFSDLSDTTSESMVFTKTLQRLTEFPSIDAAMFFTGCLLALTVTIVSMRNVWKPTSWHWKVWTTLWTFFQGGLLEVLYYGSFDAFISGGVCSVWSGYSLYWWLIRYLLTPKSTFGRILLTSAGALVAIVLLRNLVGEVTKREVVRTNDEEEAQVGRNLSQQYHGVKNE